MFKEYDCFRLARPLPSQMIPVGAVGVILMVFDGAARQYEVEFPDGEGGSLGTSPTFTISEDFMLPFEKSEIERPPDSK